MNKRGVAELFNLNWKSGYYVCRDLALRGKTGAFLNANFYKLVEFSEIRLVWGKKLEFFQYRYVNLNMFENSRNETVYIKPMSMVLQVNLNL